MQNFRLINTSTHHLPSPFLGWPGVATPGWQRCPGTPLTQLWHGLAGPGPPALSWAELEGAISPSTLFHSLISLSLFLSLTVSLYSSSSLFLSSLYLSPYFSL